MLLSILLYVGLLAGLLGGPSLLRPFGLLGIRSTRFASGRRANAWQEP